jgi:hypothetical protein
LAPTDRNWPAVGLQFVCHPDTPRPHAVAVVVFDPPQGRGGKRPEPSPPNACQPRAPRWLPVGVRRTAILSVDDGKRVLSRGVDGPATERSNHELTSGHPQLHRRRSPMTGYRPDPCDGHGGRRPSRETAVAGRVDLLPREGVGGDRPATPPRPAPTCRPPGPPVSLARGGQSAGMTGRPDTGDGRLALITVRGGPQPARGARSRCDGRWDGSRTKPPRERSGASRDGVPSWTVTRVIVTDCPRRLYTP